MVLKGMWRKMEKRILKFSVINQTIKKDNKSDFSGIAMGTSGYLIAQFDFSKESYESLAKRYMQIYPRAGCWLGPVPGMLPVVEQLHRLGIYQGILSASDRQILLQQLSYSGYPEKWFREVLGLENFYGVSKVALGQRWMEQSGISPEQVIYVGDTTHDAETAQAMGCRCILVGWGHQSVEKLEKAGVPLALTPQQLLQMLLDR